jgi:hypothetical protein
MANERTPDKVMPRAEKGPGASGQDTDDDALEKRNAESSAARARSARPIGNGHDHGSSPPAPVDEPQRDPSPEDEVRGAGAAEELVESGSTASETASDPRWPEGFALSYGNRVECTRLGDGFEQITRPFVDLVEMLTTHATRSEKDGPYITRPMGGDGSRKDANAGPWSLVPLDADRLGADGVEKMHRWLKESGFAAVLTSTFSHRRSACGRAPLCARSAESNPRQARSPARPGDGEAESTDLPPRASSP